MRLKSFLILLFCYISISCAPKSQDKQSDLPQDEKKTNIKPYTEIKNEALEKRDLFKKEYNTNINNKEKQDEIIIEAQNYLLTISDEFFKAWYNTPWTFHGHSQTPQEGSIACGYFVTTTLRDMGFNIPRIKWAQQASEYLIKKVSSDITRFHKKPMADIVSYIESKGEGLYIIGLDCHVGYIY